MSSETTTTAPSDQLRFVVTPRIRKALALATAQMDKKAVLSATKETREALHKLHKDKSANEVPLGLLRQLSRVLLQIKASSNDGSDQKSRAAVTPEQEALFNRLQIELDNKRYAKHVFLLFIYFMVKNVVATKDMTQGKRKNEFREAMHQASLGIDMIVMIVVGFIAGYFVPGVIGGTLLGVAIMLVEMVLIVIRGSRIEEQEAEKEKTKFKPKSKKKAKLSSAISVETITDDAKKRK
ncbi:uncharacterized protein ACA1_116970 [Acanthamoeba castellanii str. Neff]|uniref:Transmembrane protein n=1 Tax=Acanthamoeba castellanii (strain ATCC 30010 / Neff) TaxID=1257118 RepID=L8H3Y7_ACACF|nr:uncharacterized protein ACA1_116970 [Acanthamoeba castellanii str. Neff]ELR20224.1 hypothetical protein ACA1_116970 [Acanthamoeba castellanii str. Neff]